MYSQFDLYEINNMLHMKPFVHLCRIVKSYCFLQTLICQIKTIIKQHFEFQVQRLYPLLLCICSENTFSFEGTDLHI